MLLTKELRLVIYALPMLLLLSGCAKTVSSFEGFSVIEYDAETQDKAADEIEGLGCPTLNMFINDYSVLRDQARIK